MLNNNNNILICHFTEKKYQIQDELVTTKIKGGLIVDPDSGKY